MKGSFSENDAQSHPFEQFTRWLHQAVEAQVPEVQAMTLSTVSENNRPSSRIVYLREFDNNSFWFYGNYSSRKGQHLAANPHACLNFFWPQLERQIRIEGSVTIADAAHSDNYFNARPRESQLGAWASPQSKTLSSREELTALLKKIESSFQKFYDKSVMIFPKNSGSKLAYEFWQGRKSRLQDRICYLPQNDSWKLERLAP